MLKVYGIPNCDKMKKVFKLLEDSNITYDLYNYKKQQPTSELIDKWKKSLGDWPVNKRGTTYRKLKESFENSDDQEKCHLIIENSSMITRPIIENNNSIVCIGDLEKLSSFIKEKM